MTIANRQFQVTDPAAQQGLVQAQPLATLVVSHEGTLHVNHVPLYLDPSRGPHGTLVGHVGRGNGVWPLLPQTAVAVFHGPQAYVSPSWYPSKAIDGKQVPTWNYAAVHAHGDDGIDAALAVGADSIEHGTMLTDASIKLFKAAGAYYVPTLSTVNGYIERLAANPNAYPPDVLAKVKWRIGVTGKSLAKAYPAGVKIAFGTDAGVSKHGRNADEFELMVKHGMPASAAIQAATMNAATLLGVEKDVGSLEPGKAADLIAVAGDPTSDVTVLKAVKFVMKDGRVFKDE